MRETFEWDTILEGDVNKLFKKKTSTKIRNFVTRAKASLKKAPHVTLEDWMQMEIRFHDHAYADKCTKAQGNRKEYTSNGGVTYCGGSITAIEHQKRLVCNLEHLL